MRITEIIRELLDVIDSIDTDKGGYTDNDIKRFTQVADVIDTDAPEGYANTPRERMASIDAVTTDAGADSWQGTKDVDDIRGTTTRIHGNN